MNIIIMNRGDTYNFNLDIYDGCNEYEIQADDIIYFGVMFPHQRFEDAIIKKVYKIEANTSTVVFALKPEDTINLEPGVYYYQIKLRQHAGEETENVYTIINKTKLVIND